MTGEDGWRFDSTVREYSNADGRVLTHADLIEMIEALPTLYVETCYQIAEDLANDGDLERWHNFATDIVSEALTMSYMLGAGGIDMMTDELWGALGATVATQYDYLNNFAQSILIGEMTKLQIAARLAQYFAQARSNYWKGFTGSRGFTLPQVPGDGQTVCKGYCHCHLEFEETPLEWRIRWVLGLAEHCEDCVQLSLQWAPLVIRK